MLIGLSTTVPWIYRSPSSLDLLLIPHGKKADETFHVVMLNMKTFLNKILNAKMFLTI